MRHKYSLDEEQFLIDNVKGITLKKLTKRFNNKFNTNLSERAIQNRKHKLGLKSGIMGGQFEKGHKPFNKGKKWDEYLSKKSQLNCMKTTFKKGNAPQNYKPIGSERFDKNGYVTIKVKEPNKWERKHRVIYKSMYGNIPKGYKVIFADGDIYNFDKSNLILVSSSELLIMNREGLYKREKKLTKTGSLIAKVIDRTNKIDKDLKRKE